MRPLRDILSKLSVFTVIAMSLAIAAVATVHVARHYGWNPTPTALASPSRSGLDQSSQQEAGFVDPTVQHDGLDSIPTDAPGADVLKRGALKSGTWLPILMYHYVRVATPGDRAGFALSVTPADFTAQMDYLKANGYTTLTMRDVDQILLGQKKAPAKPIALTFDDGYTDFYTTAAPILRAHGLTATNYIPTQLVGDNPGAYMTWAEIAELDQQGFEMAAHSQFHVDVSKVSEQRAKIEIFGARADLEQHLGHQVVDWAYPYGAFSYAAIKLVHDAGFLSATTTQGGVYHDAGEMPLLTRVRVGGGESLAQFQGAIAKP